MKKRILFIIFSDMSIIGALIILTIIIVGGLYQWTTESLNHFRDVDSHVIASCILLSLVLFASGLFTVSHYAEKYNPNTYSGPHHRVVTDGLIYEIEFYDPTRLLWNIRHGWSWKCEDQVFKTKEEAKIECEKREAKRKADEAKKAYEDSIRHEWTVVV